MFERQVDGENDADGGGGDGGVSQQKRLPLGAQLVRPQSLSSGSGGGVPGNNSPTQNQPSDPVRAVVVVRTAVLIRLPCAPKVEPSEMEPHARGSIVGLATKAESSDNPTPADDEEEEELEQADLPELEIGLASLELEGEWP
jgi:hypothetical protein